MAAWPIWNIEQKFSEITGNYYYLKLIVLQLHLIFGKLLVKLAVYLTQH
jgi:hypothetical protein